MADTNTYTSKQNIKKYTTQAKFDAIDKSDVPVGTEYNIVGSIAESDLDSDLQAKVNLTGDNLTTEITGGKVKVKNPMTSTGDNGFKLNSFYNATTGVTYSFPIETPIGHFATGIVPIIGSITHTKPGSTAPATYQGVLLPNAYSENNYGPNAYAMLTMSESANSGNQIYILPYCSSNQGVSRLLSTESLEAGPGITIQNVSGAPGRLQISADGGGGGGNIDLYKHTVSITGESESSSLSTMNIEGYIIFYSSNSLECNSLTDLKTVLGDTFIENAFGYATQLNTNDIFAIDYVTETSIYFSGANSSSQNGKGTVPFTMTLTLVDAVTTI